MIRKIVFVLVIGLALAAALIPAGGVEAQCGCRCSSPCRLECSGECWGGIGCSIECQWIDASGCEACLDDCTDKRCYQSCGDAVTPCAFACFDAHFPDSAAVDACARNCAAAYNTCMRTCSDSSCAFGDVRLDQYSCAQPVATYCTADGIEVWDIDAAGNGALLLTAPAEGDIPASNQTLAQSGDVILSRLSTGEFQVNALDGEGNPYVLVWDGCPASEVYLVK